MREPDNIKEICKLKPDFIGYIFFRDSKRYVGEAPDHEIFRIPGESIKKVGVFVNEDPENVMRLFEKYNLDLVQLHGDESPECCYYLAQKGIPIIKAFKPFQSGTGIALEACIEQIKYILFDNPTDQYGGSGQKFDWNLIRNYSVPLHFFLSGGIGPGDAEQVSSFRHDWLFALDINSRF